MNQDFVRRAIAHKGLPQIKHVKSGGIYYLKEIIKSKVNGEWKDSVIYFDTTGKFCRLIDDFSGFEYIINEE